MLIQHPPHADLSFLSLLSSSKHRFVELPFGGWKTQFQQGKNPPNLHIYNQKAKYKYKMEEMCNYIKMGVKYDNYTMFPQ